MARGRKSETSEFTTKVVNSLLDTNVFEKVEATGNTILAVLNGFEFKFGPRPSKGIVIGESKFSKEQCIASVAEFIKQFGIPSSTKYNNWVKTDETRKKSLPSTHAVMQTLGVWPSRAIISIIMTGQSLSDFEPDAIIARQQELDAPEVIEAEEVNPATE